MPASVSFYMSNFFVIDTNTMWNYQVIRHHW
jgi:hypothetical protein